MVGKSILDYALSARLRPNRLRFRAYSRAMSRDQRFYKFIEGNKDRIIRITGAASDKAARYDRTLKQCIIGHTLSDGTGTEYIVECSSRFIPSAIVSQFQVCSWPAAGHRASVGRASQASRSTWLHVCGIGGGRPELNPPLSSGRRRANHEIEHNE